MEVNKNRFPIAFIGIGAAKSGTTWLSDNLNKHPDIFIPEKKELQYFNPTLSRMPGVENPDTSKSIDWYHSFFDPAENEKLFGELSVEYLINAGTAQRLYDYNPNLKLLVVLRYPPAQLFSLYRYLKQRGVIKYKSFELAIEKRPDLFLEYHYAKHLQPFYKLFSKEQILVKRFDDIKKDAQLFYDDVLAFLGLPAYKPEGLLEKSNKTKASRYPLLTYFVQNTRQLITRLGLDGIVPFLRAIGLVKLGTAIRDQEGTKEEGERLKAETTIKLHEHYLEDMRSLTELTGTDFSSWLDISE